MCLGIATRGYGYELVKIKILDYNQFLVIESMRPRYKHHQGS